MTTETADWLTLAENLARDGQQPGQSFAQAFAEVTKSGAGRHAMLMHRSPRGRQPRPVHVVEKRPSVAEAEAQLHRLATDRARAEGVSYEQAMAALLASAEGRALWLATRGESVNL